MVLAGLSNIACIAVISIIASDQLGYWYYWYNGGDSYYFDCTLLPTSSPSAGNHYDCPQYYLDNLESSRNRFPAERAYAQAASFVICILTIEFIRSLFVLFFACIDCCKRHSLVSIQYSLKYYLSHFINFYSQQTPVSKSPPFIHLSIYPFITNTTSTKIKMTPFADKIIS